MEISEQNSATLLNISTNFNYNVVQDEAVMRSSQLTSMCSIPITLKAVINLGVMEVLAEAADTLQSAAEIVERLQKAAKDKEHAAATLDRMLRLLASHGILREEKTIGDVQKYGLNSISHNFVGAATGAALSLIHHHKLLMDTWQYLEDSVMDAGDPFAKAHGGLDMFSYARLYEPAFDMLFNRALAHVSHAQMHMLLDSSYAARLFGDGSFRSLVDVGGGFGMCLEMIVARFPHITTAINFDQPHVVQAAPTSSSAIKHVGGDMFESIPSTEAIFLKCVLHDWSDKDCLIILKNCYKALPPNGKIIMVDTIIPTSIEKCLPAQLAYQWDVLMFAYTRGGKERTKEEIDNLVTNAGFSCMEVICKLNEYSVIEIFKH